MLARNFTPSPRSCCALFPGIYESDDINAIMSEMEKALSYSQKVCLTCGANDYTAFSSRVLGMPYKVPQTGFLKMTRIFSWFQKSKIKVSKEPWPPPPQVLRRIPLSGGEIALGAC